MSLLREFMDWMHVLGALLFFWAMSYGHGLNAFSLTGMAVYLFIPFMSMVLILLVCVLMKPSLKADTKLPRLASDFSKIHPRSMIMVGITEDSIFILPLLFIPDQYLIAASCVSAALFFLVHVPTYGLKLSIPKILVFFIALYVAKKYGFLTSVVSHGVLDLVLWSMVLLGMQGTKAHTNNELPH